jgi:hypothetical protein
MAYTLSDHFRPLRIVMRCNGLLVGVVLGLLFLSLSKATLTAWGIYTGGVLWPLRLAGALLLTFGITFLLAANQDLISLLMLLSMSIANALVALVMLFAYFQQELSQVALSGRLLFIFIFLLCLISAITPLRYLRAEYRS